MRIKEAAGWNQTEIDWHNLLHLSPENCWGLECEGVLAATTTSVCYGGSLAWIGMVLTDPEFRRRGFGRRLMEHALSAVDSQVDWIKLDATDMGAPLYRDLGFQDECPIERWGATVVQPHAAAQGITGNSAGGWNSLDGTANGADRSALLATLAPLGAAAIPGRAYAMGRPGSKAAYFGPCVSQSPEAARELLIWFLNRHPGEAVYWDLLPDNTEAVGLARQFGFQPLRRLVRMIRPGKPGAQSLKPDLSQTFAIAGFEYG